MMKSLAYLLIASMTCECALCGDHSRLPVRVAAEPSRTCERIREWLTDGTLEISSPYQTRAEQLRAAKVRGNPNGTFVCNEDAASSTYDESKPNYAGFSGYGSAGQDLGRPLGHRASQQAQWRGLGGKSMETMCGGN
jgi:hypothetical protein